MGRKGGISRASARAFALASGQIESEFYYDYAKQSQSKPILKRMNVNFCATGYYESKPTFAANNPNVEFTTA